MRLGDPPDPHVELTVLPEKYSGGQVAAEVWAHVKVNANEFTGELASCIARADWEKFLADLAALEAARRGEAILRSAISSELMLRIYASDGVGHMAIDGRLQREEQPGSPALTFSGVAFDPGALFGLVRELRRAAA
jgi:hypothetical protein